MRVGRSDLLVVQSLTLLADEKFGPGRSVQNKARGKEVRFRYGCERTDQTQRTYRTARVQ